MALLSLTGDVATESTLAVAQRRYRVMLAMVLPG
jgi:hypothetical protein